MNSRRVLGIYRERVFSPGKVADDAAILDATLEELRGAGIGADSMRAESVDAHTSRPPFVLTMAQSPRVLSILEEWAGKGTRIVNSVQSIRNCYRKPLVRILQGTDIPIPPGRIVPRGGVEEAISAVSWKPSTRIWLKRGDVHATQEGDVISVVSPAELTRAMVHFRRQNIQNILVQGHVEGLVVKFYGVGCNEYFAAFPAAAGHDVTPQVEGLWDVARRAAMAVGLDVYGGDAVISPGGGIVLIDLNDWPSFSRCRRPAARRIAGAMLEVMSEQ